MARNNVYKHARNIRVTAPYDVTSGQAVQVGAINGVAQISAAEGEPVAIDREGSWNIPVQGSATEGDVVNISGSGNLTAGSSGTPWGISLGTKGSGTADLEVTPLPATVAAPASGGDD